jgi:hypothetical protein
MNKHLKDCGKDVVKSAIDCSRLIGKQSGGYHEDAWDC